MIKRLLDYADWATSSWRNFGWYLLSCFGIWLFCTVMFLELWTGEQLHG